jgi:hypothetical protein
LSWPDCKCDATVTPGSENPALLTTEINALGVTAVISNRLLGGKLDTSVRDDDDFR